MQREYEDIIRDELHRSLSSGTPLPSTQTLIDRRRTLMTPIPSSSHKLSQGFCSSPDKEVERILRSRRKTYDYACSENITSGLSSDEDSNVRPYIDGTNITRRNSSMFLNLLGSNTELKIDNTIEDSNMDITCLGKSTPLKSNLRSARSNLFGRSTNMTNLENVSISNDSLCDQTKERSGPNNPTENICQTNLPKIKYTESGDKSDRGRKSKLNTNRDSHQTNNALAAELSHEFTNLQILSKNVSSNNVAKQEISTCNDVCNVASSVIAEKSSSTNMSLLQVSLNKEKSESNKVNEIGGVSTSTNMSSLLIASDSSKDKSTSCKNSNTALDSNKNSIDKSSSFQEKDSFSAITAGVIKQVLQMLDETPPKDDKVTRRQKIQSAETKRVYNTRRRTTLAPDVNVMESDSDMPSPLKKSKNGEDKSHNSSTDIEFTHPKKDMIKSADKKKKSKKRISKNVNVNSNSSKQEKHCPLSDNSQNSLEYNGSNKKFNKTKKLYNPEEPINEMITNDDLERERKRNNAKKRRSDEGVVLNIVTISPNTMLTAAAKEYVEQNKIDIKDILNKSVEQSPNNAKPSKQRKPKKNVDQISRNSAADEQCQLAEEFLSKKNNKLSEKTKQKNISKKQENIERRKSTRLVKSPRKKLNLDTSSSSSDERVVPTTPLVNRRSTMEFQTKSQMSSNKKLKIDKNKRPSIVCTKLHKEDIQMFSQIVKQLGGFVIEDEVSSKTTHLVAGEPKRTINMLRAMTMGCWILKHEWLLRSLEERKWLPEEDYEETDFSPAVQQCRLQRQAFGPSYTMDIFQDCGPIYIARGTIPRCSDLKELVDLCKGHVCTIPRNAAISVGEYVKYVGVKCVKESWVLDSITFNKIMPFKRYIITPTNHSPTV